MMRDAPLSFILMIVELPLAVFMAWAEVKLPALAIAEVTSHKTLEHAAIRIGIFTGIMLLADVAKAFCHSIAESYLRKYRFIKGVK